MDNNWIVENLTNAFGVWNSKMTEMWSLLTESPQTFKGGTIWQTIVTINGGMQAIGYGLLVLFFAIGIFRSASGFRDFQRPEHLLRHFIYFVLAKLGITYGMDLLVNIFDVCSGIVATAAGSIGGVMPGILSFAAGAMIYVVVEELIPEAHLGEHSHVGSVSVMAGFLCMMLLDVLLGA